MSVIISVLGCMRCGKCRSVCDTGALENIDGYARMDHEKCNLCMRCVHICPNKALKPIEI